MITFIIKLINYINDKLLNKLNYIRLLLYTGKLSLGKNCIINQKLKLKDFSNKGKIIIGDNCIFGYRYGGGWDTGMIELQTRKEDAIIEIGNNVSTNNNIFVCSRKKIVIGDNTLIGRNVIIMDHNGHSVNPNFRNNPGTAVEIKIGDNVWIGSNVVILPGTMIGNNSVISAGSIVKGSFPENVIIGGNPAIILKSIGCEDKNVRI